MKNKKGFTLVEIIAAVIILGIISLVAVITYTGSMKEFRDSYYTSLEKTMVEAGREFFGDNRSYRPTAVFESQKVPISLLESKSYVKDVKDYNGDKCDRSSYVIAIKNGKNDYVYQACLVCSEDTYTNTDNVYCNSAWDDNTTIQPTLETLNDVYVYRGTSREKLREKLKATISITKFDSTGTKLASVDGTGIDGVPTIMPENIDIVDTSKIGDYVLTYRYNSTSVERTVHVYENNAPTVTIQKKNVYANTIVENTVTEATEQNAYGENDWAQELIFTFTPGSVFHTEGDVTAKSYQWDKNGRWETICTVDGENGSCTTNYAQEMNENIKFRLVDSEGNISAETITRPLRIDRTAPTCTLKATGTLGSNDWYNSNVDISFDVLRDNSSSLAEAKSGIAFNQIRKGNEQYTYNGRTANTLLTYSDEGGYVTYYGIVEDKAKNYSKCSIQVRKDSVAPDCSITEQAKLTCTDSTSKLVKAYFGTDVNSTSGDALNYLSSWTDTKSYAAGTYYLKATDHAGNVKTVITNYYTVTYNKNGGDTNPTKTSELRRIGTNADLSPIVRKGGYKMIGWNTSSSATSAVSSQAVNNNITLYAIFTGCGKGYYTNDSGNGCTQCPSGYRAGAQASNSSGCVAESVTCSAGYYLKANSTTCSKCEAGYYCSGGTYSYPSGGGRKACSSGYTNTAGQSKKSSCCKKTTVTYTYCPGENVGGWCVETSTRTGNGATCTSSGWQCTYGSSTHCYNGNISAAPSGACATGSHCDCRIKLDYATGTREETTCE